MILGDFGPFLVDLGSLWDHFGIVLASRWCRFNPILRPFGPWGYFLTMFGPFSPFLGHFTVILRLFSEVDCKFKQNDAREGKYANLC